MTLSGRHNFVSLGDGFEAHAGRFLFHPATCTVIFSDVHLGLEGTLRAQGIDFPEMNLSQLLVKCAGIVALMREALVGGARGRVVIAGDFLDDRAERNGASKGWEQAREMGGVLGEVAEVILVPGNHDPAVGRLEAELPGVRIEEWMEVGGYAVIHGDIGVEKLPRLAEARVKGFIAGHLHPVVVLGDRVRSAKMPVFLRCEIGGGKRLLVLPTFSRMPIGTNVGVERHWFLPFARPGEEAMEVYGVVESANGEGRVLDYGTMAGLRGMMG